MPDNSEPTSTQAGNLTSKKKALLAKWSKGNFGRTEREQTIPKHSTSGNRPLSFAQQRLWFLDRLVSGSTAYNVPCVVRLQGSLNREALAASITEIARRHDILRTTITEDNGIPAQHIHPAQPITIPVIDLQDITQQEECVEDLLCQEAQHPFDLTQGPLLRAYLLQLQHQEHVFLLSMHHIVSDGWSLGILVHELSVLYKAYCTKKPSPLAEPLLQYADYAQWQRDWLRGKRLEEQISYWRDQLAEAPELTTFPIDYPRPAIQHFRGTNSVFRIASVLTRSLRQLSQSENVSLFMTLLTTFKVLLFSYTGQTDLLIGTPIANRTRIELESVIGYFANTLVLRTDLSGDPTFRELLNQVLNVTLQAYAYQDLPFEKLVEELHVEHQMSHNPLFQVMVALQNTPTHEEDLVGLKFMPQKVGERGTAKFDLWLSIMDEGEELECTLEYNTDLYKPETIAQIARHFQMLLHAVVQQPDQPISCLTLLSPEEQSLLLRLSQPQEYPYPLAPLHLLFEQQVDRTPEAVALCFEQEHLTYQHLENCANRLAATLRHHGVTPDVRVGLCAQRSPELVIGLLAILKAGGAYVPLDPSYPQERLAFLLQDAQVHLLLSQRSLQGQLPACPCPVLWLDDAQHLPAFPVPHRLSLPVSLDQLCYVIYTSGSTGQPKGVLLSHRSVCNRLLWMQEHYPLSSQDAVLQKTPFTFDVSVWEFFWPLLAGARLVLARPEGHRDPGYLRQVIQEQQISTLHFVPSMFQAFLHEPELESSCRSLRHVFCSGEALPLALQESFFARLGTVPGLHLYNLYGPTEASIDVTAWTCQPQPPHRSVPIGTPIANMEVYVLDEQLQLVPRGAIGELYLGGVGLARGYQQRPALTAERFVPHPWSRHVGERLYRTGDLVRFWADGTLEYLGRRDQQIKVRGFRVELGEIEATLLGHPQVAQAAVLATKAIGDLPGQLLAFLVVAHTIPANQTDLQLVTEHASRWQQVFNATSVVSATPTLTDPTLHFGGWNSSYTGMSIPQEDMRLWLENTVQRILTLRPEHVLEIGCGTGLLLFQLLPHIQHYWGSDISNAALSYIQHHLASQMSARVHLQLQDAITASARESNKADTIILNSVVQYFPSLDYFLQVLRQAISQVRPGGALFLGDLRHYGLLELFHTSVSIAQTTDETVLAELHRHIFQRLDQEDELLLSPSFFWTLPTVLPDIHSVEVLLKRGGDNELTTYRYDVILRLFPPPTSSQPLIWRHWQEEQWSLARLEATLQEQHPLILSLDQIPNARLQSVLNTQKALKQADPTQTLSHLKTQLVTKTTVQESVDPEDLWHMAEVLGYSVRISWLPEQDIEYFVAVFEREQVTIPVPLWQPSMQKTSPSLNHHANQPLRVQRQRQLQDQVRQWLKERLPDYMLPSRIIALERFPLASNGKLDQRTLLTYAESPKDLTASMVLPRTRVEKILASAWQQVLGIERVGVHHNFFEIGGDSIRSIQVVSRVHDAGLKITPQQMFKYQTIAELVSIIDQEATEIITETAGHSVLALTPFQHQVVTSQIPHQQLVHIQKYSVHTLVDIAHLETVIRQLLHNQDGMRLQAVQKNNRWQTTLLSPQDALNFTVINVADIPAHAYETIIEQTITQLKRTIELGKNLLRFVFMKREAAQPGLLLIGIHRFLVDSRSLHLLSTEIEAICQQYMNNSTPRHASQHATFAQWTQYIEAYRQSQSFKKDIQYWDHLSRHNFRQLFPDERNESEPESPSKHILSTLNPEETEDLLRYVPQRYHCQHQVIIITALAQTLYKQMSRQAFLLNVAFEHHHSVFEGKNFAYTIGGLTTISPIGVRYNPNHSLGEALKATKVLLHHIPQEGLAFGIQRSLGITGNSSDPRVDTAQVEICIHPLSLSNENEGRPLYIRQIDEKRAKDIQEFADMGCPLDIHFTVENDHFTVHWITAQGRGVSTRLVEQLADTYKETLQDIIRYCLTSRETGYIPLDFPLADLQKADLDLITQQVTSIEDIYPLTPMQQHMLNQKLHAPQPGLYVVHECFPIRGLQLDVQAFQRAWYEVITRNPALRASFFWQRKGQPLQIIHSNVEERFELYDWRQYSSQEQSEHLNAYIQHYRAKGFDLSNPSQMQLTLIQTGEDTYQFFFCFNYMRQDGWSFPLIMREFFACYAAYRGQQPLEISCNPPYRHFIAWLQQQDQQKLQDFWSQRLAQQHIPTPIIERSRQPVDNRNSHFSGFIKQTAQLSVAATTALKALARQHQLTLNTLVLAAWSLTLSVYTKEQQVVFGTTVSGRPPALAQVEYIVGLFNHIIPMDVTIPREQLVINWLKDLQSQQVEIRQYEYCSTQQIQEWLHLSEEQRIFESYLVFENFPLDGDVMDQMKKWTIGSSNALAQTEQPLRVEIVPGPALMLSMSYYRHLLSDEVVAHLMQKFQFTLSQLNTHTHAPVSSLYSRIDSLEYHD